MCPARGLHRLSGLESGAASQIILAANAPIRWVTPSGPQAVSQQWLVEQDGSAPHTRLTVQKHVTVAESLKGVVSQTLCRSKPRKRT
jgi:hypothetical protein